jgi:hypothetical protein
MRPIGLCPNKRWRLDKQALGQPGEIVSWNRCELIIRQRQQSASADEAQ